jgi:hypothetical protein
VPHLGKAVLHSPADFVRRAAHPFRRGALFHLGEDPRRFRRIEQRLWRAINVSAAAFEPA